MKELSTTTTTTTTRRVSVIFALVIFVFFFLSAVLTGLYHLSHSVLRLFSICFLLCVLICYTFTSLLSLSLSLCVFTFCFVFFFLYILFVPQSLFSPLSFSTSYRNKDIILLLLLFVHIILFLTWLQIPILWIPVHQVFFRWIWIPQQLLLIGSFFSLVSLRNLI